MNTNLAVYISSSVSKDGTRFSIKALEDLLWQGAKKGRPLCVSHDFTRIIGWNSPFALYFEPLLCRLVGATSICESSEDVTALNLRIDEWQNTDGNKSFLQYLETFKSALSQHFSGNQSFISLSVPSCIDKDIVLKAYPDIFSDVDKSGLIYLRAILKHFDHIGGGVFKDKKSNFVIFAHNYFRRSLSKYNNLNFHFLNHFLSFHDNPDVVLRIRIDSDRIGYVEDFSQPLEYEYWFGPKFSEDISKIKNGVTSHVMDEVRKFYNGIERTEFNRKLEGGEQTFEIEEVREKPSLGISSSDFGCIYIHSQFDEVTKNFKHFDGAIRLYNEEQMTHRSQSDIISVGKSSNYTKLFRIDGQLKLSVWQALIHDYFQGNNLIQEYFTGIEIDDSLDVPEDHADLNGDNPCLTLAPLALFPEDGLRMAISYFDLSNFKFRDFEIEAWTHMMWGCDILEDGTEVVDIQVVELQKELLRMGCDLVLPKNLKYYDCKYSMVLNIPRILVRNNCSRSDDIAIILQAIYSLLNSPRFVKETISFTINWQSNDYLVGVSILGHKIAICNWIRENRTIPEQHEEFREWLEGMNTYLATFAANIDFPEIRSILTTDGVLYVKHEPAAKYLSSEIVHYTEDGKYACTPKVEYRELFQSSVPPRLSPLSLIIECTCSECGEDYLHCVHSYTVEDVQRIDGKVEIMGYYFV